jgi:hypothetical protein
LADGRVPETYELQFEPNCAGGYNVHGSNSYEYDGEMHHQEVTGVLQPATGASSWKTAEGVPMQFWLVKTTKKRKAASPAKSPSRAKASQRSSSSGSSKKASATAAKKQPPARKAAGKTAAATAEAAPAAPVSQAAAAAAEQNAAAPIPAVQQPETVGIPANDGAINSAADTALASGPTAVHFAVEQAVVAVAVKPEAVDDVVDLTAADTAAAATNEAIAEQPTAALTADEQQQQIDAIVQRESTAPAHYASNPGMSSRYSY